MNNRTRSLSNRSWSTQFLRLLSPVRTLLGLVVAVFLPGVAAATHLVGGQLEMAEASTRPGHFRIIMTYYYNEAQTLNFPQATSTVVIFRKSDGRQMAQFTLPNTTVFNRPPVAFTNPACARLRNLSVSIVRFEGEIQLDPAGYDEPQGYYLTQQNCCRNGGITNLSTPQITPFLFYLEFPALLRAGQAIRNSSPVFEPLSGEYVCRGMPFRFSCAARDADGDELRYSLVTPLAGSFVTSTNTAIIRPAPYPEVSWQTGYAAPNAISGSPPLSVDARTGVLSVTADQLGLFVFSVRVEEFRNGVKIGEVRRDYQFLVVDCPTTGPAPASIRIQNQPVGASEARLCAGRFLRLEATTDPTWNYQWLRNDLSIVGATNPTLNVSEPGEYMVVTSLKSECSQHVRSGTVRILDAASSVIGLSVAGGPEICQRGKTTTTLSGPPGNQYAYRWFHDGVALSGQTADTLAANRPGRYSAILTDQVQGCDSRSDTVTVRQRPDPLITLAGGTDLCPGDSLPLSADGGVRYTWNLDNRVLSSATQRQFFAKTPGRYTVTGTNAAGCVATSLALDLQLLVRIPITLDSLPVLCGPDHSPVALRASPTGGIFSGTGVNGETFAPRQAGVGTHELTYTIQNPTNQCQNGTARRKVVIAAVPKVELPAEVTTYLGGSVSLRPVLTGQPLRFTWQPTTFLSASEQPNVRATEIANDIVYTLTVENAAGCRARDSVQVRVYQRIWVPQVFTPNGDGLNDVWELKGTEAYPQARVTVYNRWGEVVFQAAEGYSAPFDGMLNGQALPTGNYVYALRPAPNQPTLRGVVLIAR